MDEHTWLQREVEALYEITRAINASLSQQEVLSVMLERIVTQLSYKAATLRLVDEEQHQLDLKAAYGLSEAYLAKGIVDVEHSGIDREILTGQQATLQDVRDTPGFQYSGAAVDEGLAGMLATPLMVYDHVIGVLHVYTEEPHDFSAEEKEFMAAVANLGAQAIQRSRFFDAFRRIARDINSSLELKDVLTNFLLAAVEELNVKAGSIRLLGPRRQTLHLAAAFGLSETYLQKGAIKVAQSPVDQRVLQNAQPVVITDLAQEESGLQYPEEAHREGILSVLVVPLQVRGTMVGVLRLYSGRVRRFSPEEISFAAAMANLGAVAIENAKLHEALKQRLEALKEDVDGWYRFLILG